MGKRRQTLKTAFLDSSVLFTAVNSPTGGSAKLFTLRNIKLISSPLVLTEVERNVRKKLYSHHLDRFFKLADKLSIFDDILKQSLIKQAQEAIAKKDATILATAKISKPDFLFTLDRKHFFTKEAKKFISSVRIVTPKIFFAEFGNV